MFGLEEKENRESWQIGLTTEVEHFVRYPIVLGAILGTRFFDDGDKMVIR